MSSIRPIADNQLPWLPEICKSTSLAIATDPETRTTFIFLSACKRWSCPQCGPRKKHELARRIKRAKPTRFLTLTVRNPTAPPTPDAVNKGDFDSPEPPPDPRHAYDQTRRKCSELFRHFAKLGKKQEYVRILEQTKTGWPHYHYLMRGQHFWPQAEISSVWKRLTGSYVVDIQFVGNQTKSVSYVAKYLTKADGVTFTNRRVSASRNFFPPARPKTKASLENWKFWSKHEARSKIIDLSEWHAFNPTQSMNVFTLEPRQDGDQLPETVENWLEKTFEINS